MNLVKSRHALFVAGDGWGHLRPFISLAAKLVHERPDVIITFTTPGDFKSKVENEIDRYFNNDEEVLKENIRLLTLGGNDNVNIIQKYQAYLRDFARVFPEIYGENPISYATGQALQPTTRPDVILLDPFLFEALKTIRNVSGNAIPVIAWNSAALIAMLRWSGPPSMGGLGNVSLKAEALAKEMGKSVDEFLTELYQPVTGEVVELPGMPAMYDYEYTPQHMDARLISFQNWVFPGVFRFFEECDGIVALSNTAFEPRACAAYRTWFAPRPAYFVGPLIPDEDETPVGHSLSNSQEKELAGSSNGSEIKTFLDRIQNTHGNHSLLYISFGSHFWPIGDGVWKLLEVVLDMKIPLILSHNPQKIEMPPHIQNQIQALEIALVSTWAPQHLILGHEATGWFLTHCGNNSITEAVANGVPMIAWPLGADQPVNAAYISSTLNIAHELYETRTGVGLKPLRRGIQPEGTLEAIEREVRSVLTQAWGSDGRIKRENIQSLKMKMKMAWNEAGDARNEFRRFLNKYLPLK